MLTDEVVVFDDVEWKKTLIFAPVVENYVGVCIMHELQKYRGSALL